jgi:hypothetical protein
MSFRDGSNRTMMREMAGMNTFSLAHSRSLAEKLQQRLLGRRIDLHLIADDPPTTAALFSRNPAGQKSRDP